MGSSRISEVGFKPTEVGFSTTAMVFEETDM